MMCSDTDQQLPWQNPPSPASVLCGENCHVNFQQGAVPPGQVSNPIFDLLLSSGFTRLNLGQKHLLLHLAKNPCSTATCVSGRRPFLLLMNATCQMCGFVGSPLTSFCPSPQPLIKCVPLLEQTERWFTPPVILLECVWTWTTQQPILLMALLVRPVWTKYAKQCMQLLMSRHSVMSLRMCNVNRVKRCSKFCSLLKCKHFLLLQWLGTGQAFARDWNWCVRSWRWWSSLSAPAFPHPSH